MAMSSGGHLINTPEPTSLPEGDVEAARIEGESGSPTREILRRTFHKKSAVIGLIIVILVILSQLIGPYIRPHDPYKLNLAADAIYNAPPSSQHWLGTDDLGRDILSRLLVGGRISIAIAFAATAISLIVGVIVGGLSGFMRGWTDSILSMITNWFLSFPFFLLALSIVAVRGAGAGSVMLALGLTGWAPFARLLRGQVLGTRETEYVEAAKASGAGGYRIMMKHVLPNSMAPVLVLASLSIGANITGEAALSFVGVGVPPPSITWGQMAGEGQAYLTLNPIEVMAPSMMIAITLIAITLVGNALRDAADPKLKD